ncbi:MAG TPA: fused MFS/spermidine synthase [Thermoanaerobaculia bacterium]
MTTTAIESLPVADAAEVAKPAAATGRAALVLACCAAFVASFCMLVIELVAARIMAPYVGVSLYTWTSIIGVILAGISSGAYAGGLLADRYPRRSTLGWLFAVSGLAALVIAPLADAIGRWPALPHVAPTLVTRVLFLAFSVFFVPAFLLGTISPVTVKLALRNIEKSGGTVGRIYAFSTLGSIVGTFATGFLLIAWLGTRTILVSVAAVLLLSAFVFSARRTFPVLIAIAALGGAFGFAGPTRLFDLCRMRLDPMSYGDYYFKESNYYTIRLAQLQRLDQSYVEVLILDHLIHSFSDMRDPGYLHYPYLRSFDDVVRWKLRTTSSPRLLFLGGGGYTLPRYIEASVPGASIDVVEIDPDVTRAATDYLGVSAHGRIHTINADARWFVMNSRRQYDVIFCDAFNDLSIPFHLTTREFNEAVGRLVAPGGFVAANVIDNYQRGKFMPAYIRTMRAAFGAANVALVADWFSTTVDTQSTFVVLASHDTRDLMSFVNAQRSSAMHVIVDPRALDAYLRPRHPPLLTDDYAPVDNLVAALFEQRYRYRTQ